MAQMEVYDVLKKRLLSGKSDGLTSLQLSDAIINGIRKRIYSGSFDTDALEKDCRRLCSLGLIIKKRNNKGVTYRLNSKALEEG